MWYITPPVTGPSSLSTSLGPLNISEKRLTMTPLDDASPYGYPAGEEVVAAAASLSRQYFPLKVWKPQLTSLLLLDK